MTQSSAPNPPPVPLSYAQPSTPVVQPTATRGKVAICLIAASCLVAVIEMVAMYAQISLLKRVEAGGIVTPAEATANDTRVRWLAITHFVLLVGCLVAILMWQFRAYQNLIALGKPARFTPGWVVGYWFIPFINLVRPYQTMKEVHDGSPSPAAVIPGLVGLWWAFWLLSGFVSRFGAAMVRRDPSLGDLITGSWADMFSGGLHILAGVLLVLIIRAEISSQGSTAPAPVNPYMPLRPRG